MRATNVKLTNNRAEQGGEWFVDPAEWPNSPKSRNIIKTCVESAKEEPTHDWHLEFRGTQSVEWHRADHRMIALLKHEAEREVSRLRGLGWKKEDFAKALRDELEA